MKKKKIQRFGTDVKKTVDDCYKPLNKMIILSGNEELQVAKLILRKSCYPNKLNWGIKRAIRESHF